MFLRDKYYKIENIEKDGNNGTFQVRMLPESDIFKGHFPGNAICPGVCNIEIIVECASLLTGQELHISTIKQCRFTNVARPEECGLLTVKVNVTANDNDFTIVASISDQEKEYVTFKGIIE